MRIEGQSLVIIGGNSRMGFKEAVDAGADVTIAGRSQAKLDEARQAIAGDLTTRTVDVSEEQSVRTLFSQIGPFAPLAAALQERRRFKASYDTGYRSHEE